MRRMPTDELPYDVESVDVVAEAPGLMVSILVLEAGQQVPWHYHTNIDDTFFCLSGRLSVRHGRDGHAELGPGDSVEVPAGIPHQVQSANEDVCRFLIVQGIGTYDFVPTPGPD